MPHVTTHSRLCGHQPQMLQSYAYTNSAIGPELCKALPSLHALTGCDSTGALSGIGKKTALRKLQNDVQQQRRVAELGELIPPTVDTICACEECLCSLHTTVVEAGDTTDKVLHWMFCQKRQKGECLPPRPTASSSIATERTISPLSGNNY
jgi:hypothetical protein